MKSNKSYTKRLRVTKNGKILARRPGKNHFNAKQSGQSQLAGKKLATFRLTKRQSRRFLPNSI